MFLSPISKIAMHYTKYSVNMSRLSWGHEYHQGENMYSVYNFVFAYTRILNSNINCKAPQNNYLDGKSSYKKWYEDMNDMKVYSEHCTQNIVNNNKTQYKQANITTILQATMFKRGKFEVNDFYVNLYTYLNVSGVIIIINNSNSADCTVLT